MGLLTFGSMKLLRAGDDGVVRGDVFIAIPGSMINDAELLCSKPNPSFS